MHLTPSQDCPAGISQIVTEVYLSEAFNTLTDSVVVWVTEQLKGVLLH